MLYTTALAAVCGASLFVQVLDSERRERAQGQTLDTATALSGQIRADLDHLVRSLTELHEGKFRARLQSAGGSFLIEPSDLDRDVIDVAVWKRVEGAMKPQRQLVALNTLYISPAQDGLIRAQAAETIEADLIQPAFQGQVVVTLALALGPVTSLDPSNFALVAMPVGQSSQVSEVLVAHVRLARFQRAFRWDGSVRAALVNADGVVLAHSGHRFQDSRESVANHPLVQAMRSNHLLSGSGHLDFQDGRGAQNIGSYRRLNIGKLAVFTSIPENELGLGSELWTDRAVVIMAILFGLVGALGYSVSEAIHYRRKQRRAPSGPVLPSLVSSEPSATIVSEATPETIPETVEEPTLATPKRRVVTVLHGSVTQLDRVMEALGPEAAMSSLNEFISSAAARIKEFGGEFQKDSGASFVAIWTRGEVATQADWNALRCALELRRDFRRFNELRKTDGEKPLSLSLGLDSGLALAGKVNSGEESVFAVVGEVLSRARELDRVACERGTDLLVSRDVLELVESYFLSSAIGEVTLIPGVPPVTCYTIEGYREQDGFEVRVESGKEAPLLKAPEPAPDQWLVNNGSQVVGPLQSRSIASRLRAQELDFDCECWKEGSSGTPVKLSDAGVFGGSNDPGADLWVYDGQTLHGPLSRGFVETALRHGALQPQWEICQETTVRGWITLESWLKSLTSSEQKAA